MNFEAELKKIQQMVGAFGDVPAIEVPPKCFLEMAGKFISYTPGSEMVISFPLREWYANPIGVVQGGLQLAMFDNTFGPFSFIEAKRPTASIELNISFVRPLLVNSGDVTVKARKIEQSKNFMIFEGDLINDQGKRISRAYGRFQIFSNDA